MPSDPIKQGNNIKDARNLERKRTTETKHKTGKAEGVEELRAS